MPLFEQLPEDGYLVPKERSTGISGIFLALGAFVICGVAAELIKRHLNLTPDSGSLLYYVLTLLPFLLFFGGLLVLGLIWKKYRISQIVAARGFRWNVFGISLLLACGFQFLGMLLEFMMATHSFQWKGFSLQWWKLLTPLLLLFAIQTLAEEILFRWFAIRAALAVWPRAVWGILSTGALFTSLHLANPEALYIGWTNAILVYGASGVFFAYLCISTRGLEAPWAFHAINNWFGVLLLSNTASGIQTPAPMEITYQVSPWIGIFVVLSYGIQAVTFRFIYRRLK